jgi:hypothetical protein
VHRSSTEATGAERLAREGERVPTPEHQTDGPVEEGSERGVSSSHKSREFNSRRIVTDWRRWYLSVYEP